MRHIVLKLAIIAAVLGTCIWALYPPKEKLRLGKDLRGGISLVYSIKMPEDAGAAQRADILTQTIEVLKDRVNPTGVLDISIIPQGLDRIEVVMPLPSPEVRALQQAYRDGVDSLLDMAQISAPDLEEALRAGTTTERFGGVAAISGRIGDLQSNYDESRRLRTELVTAIEGGADEATISGIESSIAAAEIQEENLRREVLSMSIDEARLIRALGLSQDRQELLLDGAVVNDENGNPRMGPSPRDIEIAAIKAEFPHLGAPIDELVASYDAYTSKRKGLDDPEDLKRLLRGAGVLEFRIAVQASSPEGVNAAQLREQLLNVGPDNTDSPVARWLRVNDLKQWYDTPESLAALEADPIGYFQSTRDLVAARHNGEIYVLVYTTPSKSMVQSGDSEWAMERAFRTADELGRTAVGFSLDQSGARMMSRMTGPHVGQPMAIVLDDQVYSAPGLRSQIAGQGQISGNFNDAEISYLVRVLAAGALGARLSPEPISVSILGPSIGGDNLRKGLEACLLSVIVVGILMLAYYFFAGVVAVISLACVGLIVFGVMALIDGMFTLPGLAGIALTIGMAVDANVLIYERVREEMVGNGEDLKSALRIGFKRAFNTIIDGQLTNLIVSLVLIQVATAEVKGFAVTMTIGVLSTLFVALVVTTTIFQIYVGWLGARSLPMLPTVIPAIGRALRPSIDWMSLRKVFFAMSIVAVTVCLSGVFFLGRGMLDTEFRGGVALTLETRPATPAEVAAGDADPNSGRLLLSRTAVEERIHAVGEENRDDQILGELASASILTVGDATADFRSARFQIKVSNPRTATDEMNVSDEIVSAVVETFRDDLEAVPELDFLGAGDDDHATYTYVLEKDRLGDNINRPEYNDPIGRWLGGVAVVVDEIDPPVTIASATERIERMRRQPDFAQAFGRDDRVIGLELADPSNPDGGYSSIAVLVSDDDLNAMKVDLALWDRQLAASEWRLVSYALQQASSLQEVNSFSSAVARTLSAQAVVAVILSMLGIVAYVWFRFGSLRYSLAAIVATAHDVCIALGLLALSHVVANTALGRALLIEEFRIDLNVVAGMLTLIGYSLNDTIVILDRVRENRGKLPLASRSVINDSINQTFSRTVLTSGTTLVSIGILYIEGGTGIRPFSFVLLVGLLTGTYSSVALAAPLVYTGESQPETAPPSVGSASEKALAAASR